MPCVLLLDGVAGLWEPLDIGRASAFRKLGFGYRQYIPEMVAAPAVRDTFDVFSGTSIVNLTLGIYLVTLHQSGSLSQPLGNARLQMAGRCRESFCR